ncbi:hypothetical protein RB653_000168 [Dictyostelium firmibasis]|uniref:Uncharacterized protein n=1 Tax=Dictyostelium firmibasis TaxID=79012 RepID=A0AAN7U6P4_9MYCE
MLFKSLISSLNSSISFNANSLNVESVNLNSSYDSNGLARTITVYKTSTHAFYSRP